MKGRSTRSPRSPVLSSAEAQLYVADITESCAFYTSKLGFTIAFMYGDPPFYGQVQRDTARLNLRLVRSGTRASALRFDYR
jgi:catechol 2,3-dioxygenase-like lactoylglutathione lyase family enzyme